MMLRTMQRLFCLLLLLSPALIGGCSSEPEATPQQVNNAMTRKKAHEQGKVLDPKSQIGTRPPLKAVTLNRLTDSYLPC